MVILSSNRDSNQNANALAYVIKAGALWKVNSSLAFPPHIWNRDLLWSPTMAAIHFHQYPVNLRRVGCAAVIII